MATFDFTHRRVMIADACPDTIAQARTTYALKGLTNFTSFETGEQALNAIDVFDPDVVIFGMDLPDTDGIELLSRIRSHMEGKFSKLPTVILFDSSTQNRLKEASKLGVDGALRKPLESGKLLRMTQVAIEKSIQLGVERVDTFKLVDDKSSRTVLSEEPTPKKPPEVREAAKPLEKKEKNLSLDGAVKMVNEAGAELKAVKPKPKPPAPPVIEKTAKVPPQKPVEEPKPVEVKEAPKKQAPKKEAVKEEEPVNLEDALDDHILWVNTGHKEGKRAALKSIDMRGRELTTVDLTGVQVIGGLFTGMDLSGITLRKSNLSGSNFTGANLVKANLAVCRLKMVKLKKANLSMSDMRGADLSKADLTGANLSNSNLSAAHLEGTILKGANLSTAKGLILTQIKRAIYDKTTKLPKYLLQQKKSS
ncbi:MAG: pentapeptide repeat-containing protein [Rhodospirillales bacterium]|nr:pentapeptide repeat-containing protein [Rhodospirillales bacterium]